MLSRNYDTLRVRFEEDVCFAQIHRPAADNAINQRLIEECTELLRHCDVAAKVLVVEGLPNVFCNGADFKDIQQRIDGGSGHPEHDPGQLYDLWQRLATGPYITVAHVRGRANAGGIGFVAACDVVLCEEQSTFSLSELLFGLMPACVMPFLIRRMGFAKANYMTLMTQPIQAKQAEAWGLVDACEASSENLLRKQLLRLRRLNKTGIARYKRYASTLDASLASARTKALQANVEVFSDPDNLDRITRFVKTGRFPWEAS